MHFHVLIADGVLSAAADEPDTAIFHPAVHLDDTAIQQVRDQLRRRGLHWLARHGYLDPAAAADMGEWEHGGAERRGLTRFRVSRGTCQWPR